MKMLPASRVAAALGAVLLTIFPVLAHGQEISRQLRVQWGARPELVRAKTRVFRMERDAGGRLGLDVHARVGSAVAGASAIHPAPPQGAFQVWPVAGLGRASFRFKGRMYADSPDGLIGLAIVTPDGGWYIAGLVPGRSGARVDLSRSTGDWEALSRAQTTFSPRPGTWFWVEVDATRKKGRREWRVYAWGDGQSGPGEPLVTATEDIDAKGRGFQAGVWTAGSGNRRVEQLTLQMLQGKLVTDATTKAQSWPLSVSPAPDEGARVKTSQVKAQPLEASKEQANHFAGVKIVSRFKKEMASSTPGCNRFRYNYYGTAPSVAGSEGFLQLSPIDNDCDGLFDEDPPGWGDEDGDGQVDEDPGWEHTLSWISSDSQLGKWSTGEVRAPFVYLFQFFPFRVWVGFLHIDGSDWLLGIARIIPEGGGLVLRGHGWNAVLYELSYVALEPLTVAVLESGSPFADGQWFGREVTLTAQVGGAVGTTTLDADIDGAAYDLGATYAEEGEHEITIHATDLAGREASVSESFGVDLTPPQITDVSPADGALVGNPSLTITGKVSADTQQVTVGGTPASLGDPAGGVRSFTSSPVTLQEGANSIALEAVDRVGHTTDATEHVELDTTPPVISIASPASGMVTGQASVTVSGTAADAHLASVTVNGVTATLAGGQWTVTVPLNPGSNIVTATALDALGHSASASVNVVLDDTPPEITLYESGTEVSGPVLLGRPASFTAVVQDETQVTTSATVDGVAYTLGAPYATEGDHTLKVTSTDEAGNTASATAAFTIDLTPPVIQGLSPATDTVTGQTAIDITAQVSADTVSVSAGGVSGVLGDPAGEWRTVSLSGVALPAEGPNTIVITASDRVGNTSSLNAVYDRDTEPPVLTVSSPAAGLVTRFAVLNVTGQATDAHLDSVQVNGTAVAVAADASFSSQLTLAEGSTQVSVTATDTLGHTATITRTVTLDTEPPDIQITAGGAPLSDGFVTNQAVTPVITVTDATDVTTTVTLNGQPFASGSTVSAEGVYLLSVSAQDAAGNQASVDRTFTIDLTPPALAGIQPANGTITNITPQTITGNADDAVSVTVNGQPATLTSGVFTATDVALTEGSNAIPIVATDRAGNSSSMTLNLVLDTTPPVVSVTAPTDGQLTAASSIAVTGTANDEHLASVTVNGSAAALAGSSFQASIPLTSDGSHQLTVVATDAAGNTAHATVTIERDATAPVVTVAEPGPTAVLGAGQVTVAGTASDPHLQAVTVDGHPATLGSAGQFSSTLSLAEGPHAISVTATDSLGNAATVTRHVTIDLSAPTVSFTQPASGAILPQATVTVAGTASDADGIDHVTVNGRPAEVTAAGDFSLADLPLVEGQNTLTARAWDPAGNDGAASITVTVDTVPPTVTALAPSDGATGVPPSVGLRAVFSEPIDPATVPGSITLTSAGATVAATLTPEGDGSTVLVTPAVPLAANTQYVLSVTTGIADKAGHPLAAAAESTFTTADTQPPDPPQVNSPASPACFTTLALAGTAEAGATVEASGSITPAETTVDASGSWSLDLTPTVASGAVSVDLIAVDAAGNRSQRTPVTVDLDCEAPHVVSASWDGGTGISVELSEPPDPATVAADGSVSISGTSGPLAFTATVTDATISIELAQAPPEDEQPLTLALSSGITDPAGNPLVPYTTVFAGSSGTTLVTGKVFDDERSLPMAGAHAALVVDGVPITDPVTVTTDGRGRFQLPVVSSPIVVRVSADGYLPCWRRVVPVPGAATLLFGVRLARAATPRHVTDAAQLTSGPAQLTVSKDSLPTGGADIGLTAVSEQGLPALLPLGWTPLATAHVSVPDSVTLDPPAVLTFDVGNPANAVVARFDRDTLGWVAVADGMTANVDTSGTWAVIVPDPDPTSPGQAVPGSPLPAAAQASPGTMTAALALNPAEILPTGVSTATVTVATDNPAPSGLPVEARLDEALHLVDGRLVVLPPAATDLVLYHRDSGMVARFGVGASELARQLALDQGVKDVHISELDQTVRTESLLGPAGGSVLTGDGLGLDVPAGALDHVVGVQLEPFSTDNLPAPLPAGLTAVTAATLDLAGAQLSAPATLSFPGAGLADTQYLVLGPVDVESQTVWRLIGLATVNGDRLECRPDIVSGLTAPWVSAGGLYVVVKSDADPWAVIWGTVWDVSGSDPASPCRVDTGFGLTALTTSAGAYATAAPAGAVTLTAVDLERFNAGSTAVTATAAGHFPGTDIHLLIVAPTVTATSPADGATKVSATTPVTIDFSEPLDPDSVHSDSVTAQVTTGTNGAQPWPGHAELSQDGTRITWTPDTQFPSASQVVMTVSGTLADRQGYALNGDRTPVTFGFSVKRFLLPQDVDPAKIRLYAPGHSGAPAGEAGIVGVAGAVPGDVYVYAEDLDRQAQTTTVAVEQDGSFSIGLPLWDPSVGRGVEVGDHLLLHILGSDSTGDDLGVVPLSVWLTADGAGALVGSDGGQARTDSGIVIDVAPGAVGDGTTVTATPIADPSSVLPGSALPSFVTPRAAITLGVSPRALSGLGLELPSTLSGVDPPADPSRGMIVAAVVEIGGRSYPMMVGRAVWDADSESYRTVSPSQASSSGIERVGTLTSQGMRGVAKAEGMTHTETLGGGDVDGCAGLNGITHDMTLLILEPSEDISMIGGSAGLAGAAVVTDGGFASVPDVAGAASTSSCPYDFIVPVLTGDPYQLSVLDPDTGFLQWQGGFEPPAGGFVEIPPDTSIGAADTRLRPISGDPFDLFAFTAKPGEQQLAEGITAALASGTATVTAGGGALASGVRLALVNLKTGASTRGESASAGASLSVPAAAGEPLLLTVEGRVASASAPVTVLFGKKVEGKISKDDIALTVSGGTVPDFDVSTRGAELVVTPASGWSDDARYDLTLGPAVFQKLGSGQDNVGVSLPFEGATAHHGTPAYDGLISDGTLEGDVLLLAERGEGLKAYDVSDPSNVTLLGAFHSADGGVAAVTADGFGDVAVVTGVPPNPVSLRLLSLSDLEQPGEATQRAGLGITANETAGGGFVRAEVTATTTAFTLADPGTVLSVDRDAQTGAWTALHIPASLLTPYHPVVLEDGIGRQTLWHGTAPASGELVLHPSDLASPVAEDRPLVLRAHSDTILYAFTVAGRVMAARVTFASDGTLGLAAVAVKENIAIKTWIGTRSTACTKLGDADNVYFGRLALAPRTSGRPLLLSATPYVGLLGFLQSGTAVSLDPTYVQCLRSNAGTRLADVAAARVAWDDGTKSTIVAVVGHRRLEVLKLDEAGTPVYLGGTDTPFASYRVALGLDPIARMILVRDNAGHLALYHFTPQGAPKLIQELSIPAGTGPLVVDADAGIAYVGSTPVQYRAPTVELVADANHDGKLEPVRYLQPLGVPEAPADAGGRKAPYLGWVMV
ncbi:MAG: hypothetical protein GXP48_10930, partial [Acidobacteria bacterium]|nr:hypothetical protein [Acidobacteriota bacterium]